jgi:DNA helicase-2/ATP-dependent DNA helicase PcrA
MGAKRYPMDEVISHLLKDLNEAQKAAVSQTEGPLLILAGAGSGKTRVITYRIAYLVHIGIDPEKILAVTFTNKAAEEMNNRVRSLVPDADGAWIGTFHSTCVKILRRTIDRLGYRNNFLIYDTSDQLHLIKDCLKDLNLGEKEYRPQSVLGRISGAKNQLMGPQDYAQLITNPFEQKVAEIFYRYQKKLKDNNALDFDDIILNTVTLFIQHEDVLRSYQERFQYIMVDEYQDTNHAQYRWINLLAGGHRNICVVGDPDQAIYRWRGADFTNLLKFEDDYANTKEIILNENYRSTQNILNAANHLIKFNRMRKEKNLWSKKNTGDPIFYFNGSNEHEEVDFVINCLERFKRVEKRNYRDMVIFYRTHAQSRVFEDGLRRAGIAYQIIGGVSFYQRKEIKDVVAYLRLIEGTGDSVSFRRVVNVPARGIGDSTIDKFEKWRETRGFKVYDALQHVDEIEGLMPKARMALRDFAKVLDQLRDMKDQYQVPDFVSHLVEKIGYFDELKKIDPAMSESRIENVQEFVSFAEEYVLETQAASLRDFLERISLVSDVDQWQDAQDKLTLMTLHSAKGLEFPVVFMVGLEEGIFPHSNSASDEMELEEERRLMYVGMTRAKEKLVLSCANSRLIYGRRGSALPSRFLSEIPHELVRRVTLYDYDYEIQPEKPPAAAKSMMIAIEYLVGQKVLHPIFGIGEVMELEGEADGMKVKVAFEKNPSPKWLMTKFARLTPL